MYYVLSIKCLRNIKLLFFLILATLYLLLNTPPVNAQVMSNQDYKITTGKFNAISNSAAEKDSETKPTTNNFGQAISEGVNFKAKAGFESLKSIPPFSISLSSDIVDFGILSPTNPIIRTVDLSTYSLPVYGYSVISFENEPLTAIQSVNKTLIPDTTCDNGECDDQNASEWINTLTYGFGYRCDNLIGADCDSSFAKTNSYKHFPDISSNDDPQSIAAGFGSKDKKIRISYKVNISGTQAQNIYKNTVTYIGVPNF